METFLIILLANTLLRTVALTLASFFAFCWLVRFSRTIATVGCGMLLALSTLHLIPEAMHEGLDAHVAGVTLLVSLLIFMLLDALFFRLGAHAHGLPQVRRRAALTGGGFEYDTRGCAGSCCSAMQSQSMRMLPLAAGSAVHCAIDGLVIATAWISSMAAGTFVTLAILMHEVPQLTAQLVLMRAAGVSAKSAIVMMAVAALFAPVAGCLGYWWMSVSPVAIGIALIVSAASFLYVVFTLFVPGILHDTSASLKKDLMALLAGIALSALFVMPLHNAAHEAVHEPTHSSEAR